MDGRALKTGLLLSSLAMGLVACLNGTSSDSSESNKKKKADEPLVSGRVVGSGATYSPAGGELASGSFAPGQDTALALWKSKLTIYDGTFAETTDLMLET